MRASWPDWPSPPARRRWPRTTAPGLPPIRPRPGPAFFTHQISGWREARGARDNVVYLDVNAHDVYRLDTFGTCHGLNDALTIGVETRGGGTTICDGLDVTLITSSGIGPMRCPVSKITKLTPEEIKALKADRRR